MKEITHSKNSEQKKETDSNVSEIGGKSLQPPTSGISSIPAQLKTNTIQMMQNKHLQMKIDEDEKPKQFKKTEDNEHSLQKNIYENSGSGSNLPNEVQEKMEGAFGEDFSNVKIHEGSNAKNVGALAYTQGDNIHFAQGNYNPHTQQGQELLGHELTHVVQQRNGRVQPTVQAKGLSINDSPALEKEADDMGKKAAQGKSGNLQPAIQKKSNSTSSTNQNVIQQSGPSWWESIKKGAGIYLGITLKDEGSAYAKALMRHYALGGGGEFNPETSSVNFPTDGMWSDFMASRPEIQRAMWGKLYVKAMIAATSGTTGKQSFNDNLTGVKLNELESMRWTLHGCHRIDISGDMDVTTSGGNTNITFTNLKFAWIDVGDMHPGTKTETDSGEMVDDEDFTGAGSSFPIKIPFEMPGASVWNYSGGVVTQVSGWPDISATTAAARRE